MTRPTDNDAPEPALTAKEAEQAILRNLPRIDHHGEIVEEVGGRCDPRATALP